MPVLEKKALDDLKYTYNHYITRYNNGCKYLQKHTKEIDKWTPELLEIIDMLSVLLDELNKYITVTDDEVFNGFTL